MKRTLLTLTASIAASAAASAAVLFHTDFDEATFADTGLTADTPAPGAGDTNDGSGTITLNTTNNTLDISAMAANTWETRDGAPIASVASPTVALGVTWYVETMLTHTNSADTPNTNGGARPVYDQAGITFYSGTAGANPGSENTGTHQGLFVGINDWAGWTHRVQGFADNNPNVSAAGPATPIGSSADLFYRVEITENGTSDLYNFFYKEAAGDAWTQFGATDLAQDFDNSSVGLIVKTHNLNTGVTTSFDYLTIGSIPRSIVAIPT